MPSWIDPRSGMHFANRNDYLLDLWERLVPVLRHQAAITRPQALADWLTLHLLDFADICNQEVYDLADVQIGPVRLSDVTWTDTLTSDAATGWTARIWVGEQRPEVLVLLLRALRIVGIQPDASFAAGATDVRLASKDWASMAVMQQLCGQERSLCDLP